MEAQKLRIGENEIPLIPGLIIFTNKCIEKSLLQCAEDCAIAFQQCPNPFLFNFQKGNVYYLNYFENSYADVITKAAVTGAVFLIESVNCQIPVTDAYFMNFAKYVFPDEEGNTKLDSFRHLVRDHYSSGQAATCVAEEHTYGEISNF